MTFNIRKIQQHDLDEVVELVNVAYRTQSARAWTTEHAFVEGQRISKNQLKMMLQESNFELFVGEFGVSCMKGLLTKLWLRGAE